MTSGVGFTGSNNTEYQKPQISSSTRQQLVALGIDPSSVTSESQAQSIITAKRAEKSFQDTMSMRTEKKTDETQTDTSESSLISEARGLAEQLGLSISSEDTFEEITANIHYAIQDMMNKSTNDPQAMQRAQAYMVQLSQLNSNYSNVSTSNTNMYAAMNFQAANTRYMLGL